MRRMRCNYCSLAGYKAKGASLDLQASGVITCFEEFVLKESNIAWISQHIHGKTSIHQQILAVHFAA